jgi:DNA-binding SARP family transcriptional activator/predicted negative regulator of RcsB-dependent stress response
MRVQIDLLGQFRVRLDGREISANEWRREKSAALIKLLALSPGHRIHREKAIDLFWPDSPLDTAATNLRKALHFARRALGEHDLLALKNDIILLAPGQELHLDVEVFETAAREALRRDDPAGCAQAAGYYGGELLPDDVYLEWVEERREQLRQLDARLLRAARLWDKLLALDPTDEEAQCALMQAALDAGNRGEVIRQFQRLRERLRTDLGVGPAATTVALYEKALAAEKADTSSVADRVRSLLAWGIVSLQSGDFPKAEQLSKEARLLAIEAGLPREMGEASALYGIVAHYQGRWLEMFSTEFMEWTRREPSVTLNVLDGHLCFAEFSMYSVGGHNQVAEVARKFLTFADENGSTGGRALALLILGETELFSGNFDLAEQLLTDALQLYTEVRSDTGRILTLLRLAEIALARGQKYRAGRLVQQCLRIAESSWLAPHFLMRLQGLVIQMVGTKEKTGEAIRQGDSWLARGNMCQPCSMSFRIAATIALIETGELEKAKGRLDETERVAGMWNGGPWVASVWEVRGLLRQAQGNIQQAGALYEEAAARYAGLNRPKDQERCLARSEKAGKAELKAPI